MPGRVQGRIHLEERSPSVLQVGMPRSRVGPGDPSNEKAKFIPLENLPAIRLDYSAVKSCTVLGGEAATEKAVLTSPGLS